MATLNLHTATTAEQVEQLVSNGANVEEINELGEKPFYSACKDGKLPVVVALHEICSTQNPENKAWREGTCSVCYFVNGYKHALLSPIEIAAKEGHFYVVEFLILKGYNYDNVLYFASMEGRMDIIHHLFQLEYPPDVNREFREKFNTPLNIACSAGQYDVVNELLKRGTVVDEESLGAACVNIYSHDDVVGCSILKALVCQGANVRFASQKQYCHGRTILHVLAEKCKYTSLSFLVDMGAVMNIVDNNGFSVLWYLLKHKEPNFELIQKFIDNGEDVNLKSVFSVTLLHQEFASRHTAPRVEVVEFLIKNGADVDAVDDLGRSALHIACQSQRGDLNLIAVEALVRSGANIEIVDNRGETPLRSACRMVKNFHHTKIFKLLLE